MLSPPPFIGREREIAVLESAKRSGEAELISVVGRRRVGKTALVREVYGDRIVFELTGVQRAPRREQLRNFGLQLSRLSGFAVGPPEDWLAASHQLIGILEKHPVDTPRALFRRIALAGHPPLGLPARLRLLLEQLGLAAKFGGRHLRLGSFVDAAARGARSGRPAQSHHPACST